MSLSVSDTDFQCFSSHNPQKFSTNDLGLRIVKASPFIPQSDRMARKASDVSAADWRYQILAEKYDIFLRVLLTP